MSTVRRKKCGRCAQLFDPSVMTQVAARRYLCEACLVDAANEEAAEGEAARDRLAGIRHKRGLDDPGAQQELGETVGQQQSASRSSASTDPASPAQGEEARASDPAAASSPDLLADAIESGAVIKAADLPAPSTQADVSIDLGDPEEQLAKRPDIPDVRVEGWPLRYGRISASSLGTFLRCPEQFRRQYVEGMRTPGNSSTISGNAAHVGLEVYFRCRLEGVDAPTALWSEWADAKFDKEVAHSGGYGEVEWKTSPDDARQRAKASVDAYILNVARSLKPVSVDEVFVRTIAGVPVPLVGYLDLVEERAVIDWKFTSQVKREIAPDWRAQGLLYLLAKDLPLRWHAVGWPKKDGTCSLNTELELERSAANHRIATSLARSCVEAILAYTERFGAAGPWPGAINHTWACNSCFFRENGCAWWPQSGALPVEPVFAGQGAIEPIDPF